MQVMLIIVLHMMNKMIGKVERIAPQATIKNNIKGFDVRILLSDVDTRVRPGMTANIQIPVASAANVVAVPLAAIFTEREPGSQTSERFVYVIKNGEYDQGTLNRIEMAIRPYDPWLSCATHRLDGGMNLEMSVLDSDGKEIDKIKNF